MLKGTARECLAGTSRPVATRDGAARGRCVPWAASPATRCRQAFCGQAVGESLQAATLGPLQLLSCGRRGLLLRASGCHLPPVHWEEPHTTGSATGLPQLPAGCPQPLPGRGVLGLGCPVPRAGWHLRLYTGTRASRPLRGPASMCTHPNLRRSSPPSAVEHRGPARCPSPPCFLPPRCHRSQLLRVAPSRPCAGQETAEDA